eukprot:m.244136 g.244136  ORF g.244136 m.244136 type:complete len:129 (-) comp15351_c0_seq3:2896-3282(-)
MQSVWLRSRWSVRAREDAASRWSSQRITQQATKGIHVPQATQAHCGTGYDTISPGQWSTMKQAVHRVLTQVTELLYPADPEALLLASIERHAGTSSTSEGDKLLKSLVTVKNHAKKGSIEGRTARDPL